MYQSIIESLRTELQKITDEEKSKVLIHLKKVIAREALFHEQKQVKDRLEKIHHIFEIFPSKNRTSEVEKVLYALIIQKIDDPTVTLERFIVSLEHISDYNSQLDLQPSRLPFYGTESYSKLLLILLSIANKKSFSNLRDVTRDLMNGKIYSFFLEYFYSHEEVLEQRMETNRFIETGEVEIPITEEDVLEMLALLFTDVFYSFYEKNLEEQEEKILASPFQITTGSQFSLILLCLEYFIKKIQNDFSEIQQTLVDLNWEDINEYQENKLSQAFYAHELYLDPTKKREHYVDMVATNWLLEHQSNLEEDRFFIWDLAEEISKPVKIESIGGR